MHATRTEAPEALEDHPLLRMRAEAPPELRDAARSRGWPEGLLERALALRIPRADLEAWIRIPRISPEEVAWNVATLERTFDGALRVREATWRDHEALADLYACAPENVGDWRLVVERSPNPFAQFRLQEHVNVQVIECRGVLLAAAAHASRNTLVGGERTTVHLMSAWRVREEFRGYGLSRVLQLSAGPIGAWFGPVTYWYERLGNASQGWLDKMRTMAETRDNHVDGLTATVHLLEPAAAPTPSLLVRPTTPADIPRCVELVNRTHDGLDLFRPYTSEFLEGRLDDPSWGPKPVFWSPVYGWDDHVVVEDGGEVVACGGLWDRGRDVREVWTHRETGDRRVLAATALLDWGYAAGRPDAMAAVVRDLLERSAALGRSGLLAPLEFAPDVLAALPDVSVTTDTRALRCMGYNDEAIRVDPVLRSPYTDLAYW